MYKLYLVLLYLENLGSCIGCDITLFLELFIILFNIINPEEKLKTLVVGKFNTFLTYF